MGKRGNETENVTEGRRDKCGAIADSKLKPWDGCDAEAWHSNALSLKQRLVHKEAVEEVVSRTLCKWDLHN